ncbi:MAG: prephenate dehydrogenase/arogenate dehydrogenase family protein [Actinomycetota bacterium]
MSRSEVAILGMGLIGGSIALGLRRADPSATIVGYDVDPGALEGARRRSAVTSTATSAAAAVAGADLVVLAMPVDRMFPVLAAIAAALRADSVVTDVGSSKAEIVACGQDLCGGRFIGGHPMAGSERRGIAAADAELFQGAQWLLTPTASTEERAYRTVAELAARLGAGSVALGPYEHDRLLAHVSHLPQLAASALVSRAAEAEEQAALLGLAAGGFRDTTRIAAGDPDMWIGVLRTNRLAIIEALEGLATSWGELSRWLQEERWDLLHGFFSRASEQRKNLFVKPTGEGTPVTLTLLIPDHPGVLAEVTTAAGRLGANIEDLQIFHSTEGGRGRLEVVIAGESPAAALSHELEELGYHVQRGLPT